MSILTMILTTAFVHGDTSDSALLMAVIVMLCKK